jgi:hypothetical protein
MMRKILITMFNLIKGLFARKITNHKGRIKLLYTVFCTVFFSWSLVLNAQEVTMSDLLKEMIDRELLAKYPENNYKAKQFSSYDRRAKIPGGENWFANQDNTNFIRRELSENGAEWVMFDCKSPGAIVRWWMTFWGEGGEGIIRIYIDGDKEPVIEGTAFEVLSGGLLVEAPLSTSVSELTPYDKRGHNLYLPIPFGKSCKVTYQNESIITNEEGEIIDKKAAIYYIINYREYNANTAVESFDNHSLTKYQAELCDAQLKLAMPFNAIFNQKPEEALKMRKLDAGKSMQLEIQGESFIKAITMRLDAENIAQALRSTTISFRFDNQKSFTVPVGAFFGTGYEINPYQTYYTKVYKDGVMASAWPMPIQSNAKIEISNLGDQEVKVQDLNVYVDEWQWDDRSMYFGGSWKQFYNKQTGAGENPEDLTFNTLKGKGVYVGDLVTIYNNMAAWWGEGDEKIYVDGEKFPSHFGTGSEDYYGYAWSGPPAFSHPFIAQPDGSGNLDVGVSVNVRFRSLDKIPFTESLKMTMELLHHTKTTVNYAPTTFFYLRPGGESETEFSRIEAQRPVALAEEKTKNINPVMKGQEIQGENMEPVRIDAGILKPQASKNSIWQDDAHLWWRRANHGDVLYLQFKSDKDYTGRDIELQLTQARDYGIVEISLNDGSAITFDGYAPQVLVKKTEMKNANISKGVNTLKINLIGKNEKALTGHMFGIDYLKVKD